MSSFRDVYGFDLKKKFKHKKSRTNSFTDVSSRRDSSQSKQDIFFVRALDKIKEEKVKKYEENVKCNLDYILQYLKTYCNITTLHGFNYILKPGSALFERIFWIVALITVWLGVIFAIHNQVLNYINSSVVISVSSDKVSILDAPFPAITICSKNQMRPSLFKSAESNGNKSPSDLKRLHVYSTLASFCEASSIGDYNYDIQLNHSIIRDDWEFFYIWKQIATDECKTIVKQFKWKNVRADDPCRDAEASMTVDGICYSFNLMSPSKRYNEKYGYFHIFSLSRDSLNGDSERNNIDDDGGLYQISGGNLFTSAKIFLDFNADDISEECKSKGYGFLVRVHNPFEDPQSHQPAFIDVDKTTVIKIIPKIITSSQNLITWNPLDRGCYFNHERKLKFYKVYTQLNCEIECQANITLEQCGCNMFYQIYSFTESKICDADKFQCVLNITNNDIGKEQNPCGCLPGCNDYEYEMRTYPTTQTWAESLNSSFSISTHGFHLDRNKQKSYSSIKLEYNNEGIAKKSRIGIYSFTGFIAQIGGLLGLFVGFSLVSLIEIIYFTSIRWVATNTVDDHNNSANMP